MRVPADVLKTVAFIAEDVSGDTYEESHEMHATGFFVSVPSSVAKHVIYRYFVTAKHVAEALIDRPIAFLVNAAKGGLTAIEPIGAPGNTEQTFHWYTHPDDEAVDVAVIPFNPPTDADIVTISVNTFIRKEDIDGERIGIGDEVFMAGLFHFEHGSDDRNVPIVRFGNIAMVPTKPIYINSGFSEVYLIEARSIGGLSGSPVFVRRTMHISGANSLGAIETLQGIGVHQYFMGLAHGHWDIKESELNSVSFIQDSQRGVNLGIAIVIPAHKILEVINQPKLAEMRERAEKRLRDAITPTPDVL